MWIYLINVMTIPIYHKFIKNKKAFVIVVAIQLFLILALRDSMLGVDLPDYYSGYKYISGLGFEDMISKLNMSGVADLIHPFSFENGYVVMNWVASHIGLNFHGFLVVCAGINIGSVSYFIYKYSKKPWLSFVIFSTFGYFMYDFGILRQSLALSLFLLAYISFDKKKYLWGITSFVLSFWFHRIAIIGLPVLLLARKKHVTKKRFLCLGIMALPLMFFSRLLYDGVISKLMLSVGKGYLGHDLILNNMFLLLCGIATLVFFFYNFSKIEERINSVACYALILAIYLSIFGMYNDNLARALQFYSIFLIILIPSVIDQYKNQKASFLVEAIVYVLLVGFMYFSVRGTVIDPYVLNEGGLLWG